MLRPVPARRRFAPAGLAAALALATLAGCSGGDQQQAAVPSGGAARSLSPAEAATGAPAAAESSAPGGEGAFGRIPEILRQVEPSVVTIFVGGGLGSGVVWRPDGLIITNEHVVRPAMEQGGGEVQVGLADGSRVPGRVVAADALTDLAVVDAQRDDLPAARFRSDLPQQGELAITLGSPLGFQNTAGAGIISGLNREIPGAAARGGRALVDLIQTDAAISPGNSGGALVDGRGQVVGINEAYIPPQAGAVNLGFAIPAGRAVDVAQQLVDTGRAQHAYVGVVGDTVTPQIAGQLDVSEGVAVRAVGPGTPAAEAGVRPGDIITAVGETRVRTLEEFLGELRQERPGNVVQLRVLRGGRETTLPVTVGDLPEGAGG